jgi:hypothetical protein
MNNALEPIARNTCRLLTILLLGVLAVTAASPPTFTITEAARHVGEQGTVCGTVASARWATTVKGQPTFLNLDEPYPSQVFTVLIWGSDRTAFGQPEKGYAGRRICVSGMIESYKGKPEIIAKSPSQIRVAE